MPRLYHCSDPNATAAFSLRLEPLYCGAMSTLYCQHCGAAMDAGVRFCARCGNAQQPGMASAAPVIHSPAGAALAATAMPVAVAPYGATAAASSQYGGFWIRFVAVIIDSLVVSVITTPINFAIMIPLGLRGSSMDRGEFNPSDMALMAGSIALLACASVGIHALYEALLTSSRRQATVGKMALRLRVTDLHGNRISFARALGRYFAKLISSMTLMIGYIMAGFTERHQALHDMIAGTLVQKEPPSAVTYAAPQA